MMTIFNYSDAKELLKEVKEFRNELVAKNYPHQKLSNIITKWEDILQSEIKVTFDYTPHNEEGSGKEWRVSKATLVTGYEGKEKKQ